MNRILIFLVLTLAIFSPAGVFAAETNAAPAAFGLPAELKNFLKDAGEFTLFSIEPDPDFEHKSTNTFQTHAILGRLKIRRAETKEKLIAALDEGIVEDSKMNPPGIPAFLPDCFNPRHRIRAKKGDETIEFLTCFECSQIQVSSDKKRSWFFMTSNKPAAAFNSVLKKNGVRVPKN